MLSLFLHVEVFHPIQLALEADVLLIVIMELCIACSILYSVQLITDFLGADLFWAPTNKSAHKNYHS